jgi:multidrug resistance efflux pump
MIELLLIIYGVGVWLVFFKFKLLPWNTTSQVIVISTPIFGAIALVLTINVFQPISKDARVLRQVVQIVPRVTGRVIEVPVEGNVLVKKGDVLFRIDPSPFEFEVQRLRAELAEAQGSARALDEELRSATAQIRVARSRVEAAGSEIAATKGKVSAIQARLDLAELRVTQSRNLAETGAGNRFDLEKYQSEVAQYQADLATALAEQSSATSTEASALADENAAQAEQAQVREKLSAIVEGEQAQVARIRAQLRDAEWRLSETVIRAPADGYPVNLQVRPGSYAAALPLNPVMSFVENESVIVATYLQNALHKVKPGDHAELTLNFYPGKIFKGKVHSIVRSTGAGQLPLSGVIPQSLPVVGEGRLVVRFELEGEDAGVTVPGGTMGRAAIYTEHLHLIEIVRKVILRFESKFDYLVWEMHLPGGH